jgi:hypothetical protein
METWDTDGLEVTGGYILRKDRIKAGDQGFVTRQGIPLIYDEPKARATVPAQESWLTNFVNEFEGVLMSGQFRDPTNGYAKYIDAASFVDYHWIVEMSQGSDSFWVSQYFLKDRGGILEAGPIWDWDLSFGNALFEMTNSIAGWRWAGIDGKDYKWYGRLFEDPDFLQRYIDRWSELRKTVFATSNVLAQVDRLASEVNEAQARNYARWHTLKKPLLGVSGVLRTYDEHVKWLKDWITARLAWIDTQDFPPPVVSMLEAPPGGARMVALSCQVGRIFYVLDGSDPRMPGGQVARGALEYQSPIHLDGKKLLTARVRSDYGLWSAPATQR